ncbi:ankyrin [Xylaria arbuscula]|nr:ankyrin [Xylaria arbuscula]
MEMETYHGFPETDAKIYEYGLQHLGFKKKLGIKQWIQVDACVKKRKREGKETEVLLSGVLQPPNKIRKAISRNKKGARLQEQIVRGPTPDCPEGVLLRTPPLSPTMTIIHLPRGATQAPVASQEVLIMEGYPWQNIDFEEWSGRLRKQMVSNPDSTVHRLPHAPSSHLLLILRQPNGVEHLAIQAREPSLTDPFDFSCGAAFRIQARQHFMEELNKASIILSNGRRRDMSGVDDRRLLAWIGADTNISILKDFFTPNLPAIAATWSGLIDISHKLQSGEAFQTLVEIAFVAHNAKWIQQYSLTLLSSIVKLGYKGARKIVRRLLSSEPIRQRLSEKSLHRFFDIHEGDIQMISEFYLAGVRWDNFDTWVMYRQLLRRSKFNGSFANQQRLIQTLATTGFNFNLEVDISLVIENVFEYFDRDYDYKYFYSKKQSCPFTDALWIAGKHEMYETLLSHSAGSKTRITIVGLIKAALEGKERLLSYLDSRPPWDKHQRLALEKAFSLAASFGYVSAIKSFNKAEVDPNVRTLMSEIARFKIDWHPLMRAARAKHFDAVRLLVEMGSDLRSELEGYNPLAAAVWTPKLLSNARRLDRLKIVEYLLSKDLAHVYGVDALIKASVPPSGPRSYMEGFGEPSISPDDFVPDEEIFDTLLKNGIVLDDILEDGKNILHFAIDRDCKLRTVEFLVFRGVQIHSHPCSWDGKTMLHSAAASQSKDRQRIVELLLRNGADCTTEYGGHTILEAALSVSGDGINSWESRTSLQLFSFLLDHGAQINGPKERLPNLKKNWGPIVIRLLDISAPDALIYQTIQAGADIHSPGSGDFSYTPLQYAIMKGRLNVAYQLIASCADINFPAIGNDGCTALQAACDPDYGKEASLGVVQFLLDKGADINAPDSTYMGTALVRNDHCAKRSGSISVFCFLLDAGANIFGTAEFTTTESCALFTAIKYDRLDMVNIILERLASNGLLTKDICDMAIEDARRGYALFVLDIRDISLFGILTEGVFNDGPLSG